MEKITRVISINQPFATLLAYGIKLNETRPKATSHTFEKGQYLIHATKKWNKEIIKLCYEEPFYSILKDIGCIEKVMDINSVFLPLGKIVGSFEVKECLKVSNVSEDPKYSVLYRKLEDGDFELQKVHSPELDFGDYSIDRSIWIGQNHKVLKDTIPYRGQQGYHAKFKGNINDLKFI